MVVRVKRALSFPSRTSAISAVPVTTKAKRLNNKREKRIMRHTKLVALAATIALFATPALAHDAKVEKTVPLQAAAVWTAIGTFCDIQAWHPAVEKCTWNSVKGRETRTLALKGGGEIVERLASWDREGMSYTYTIQSGPLPVRNYRSTISVKPTKDGTGAVITWVGDFKPAKGSTKAQAVEAITGVYRAGVDGVVARATAVAERPVR